VSKIFDEILEQPIVDSNEHLQSTVIYYYASTLVQYRDFKGAIYLYKFLKKISSKEDLYYYRLKAYYQLSNCFNMLQKHKSALVFAQRALELSYYIKSKKHELKVYDLMGL